MARDRWTRMQCFLPLYRSFGDRSLVDRPIVGSLGHRRIVFLKRAVRCQGFAGWRCELAKGCNLGRTRAAYQASEG